MPYVDRRQLAVLLSVAVCWVSIAPDVSAHDNPTSGFFRGDVARTGSYSSSESGNYGGILWRKQIGGAVRSSPVVVSDKVLVGSSDGNFYALNATTGAEIWRFHADGPIASSAGAKNGRVFFSTYKGTFYAIDFASGNLLWRKTFGPELPLAYEHEKGAHQSTYNDEFIVSSAALAEDTVVVGGADGAVHTLDAHSGQERWHFQTEGRVRSSPAIADGVVYFGSYDGSVYALDLKTGRKLWRFDTMGRTLNSAEFGFDRKSILSSVTVSGGTAYFGSRDAHFYAVDTVHGKMKWSVDYEKDNMTWTVSSPSVHNGLVYNATSDGHFIQALRISDGHELWRFITPNRIWSSPAVSDSTLYIADQSSFSPTRTKEGALYAIDLASGKARWHFETASTVESSPAIANGAVYFGSSDGAIYALRASAAKPMRRAVYFDAGQVGQMPGATDYSSVKKFFQERGYETLDSKSLSSWLSDRTSDAAASVVVFASDILPASAGGPDPAHSPFRRYLDSGGKALWIGDPPLLDQLIFDSRGKLTDMTANWNAAGALLGVSYRGALHDELNDNRVTQTGRDWGLNSWWLGTWDLPTANAVVALSIDDRGFAGAWTKRFGGPAGTGFVYVGLGSWDDALLFRLAMIAEYRPNR